MFVRAGLHGFAPLQYKQKTPGYCWRTLKEGFIVLLIGSEYVQLK
jgi:hypothetical protein